VPLLGVMKRANIEQYNVFIVLQIQNMHGKNCVWSFFFSEGSNNESTFLGRYRF